MLLKIKDKEIELDRAFPLTIGDWIELEKMGLHMESSLNSAKGTRSFLAYLVRKVDASIAEDDLNSVPVTRIPKLNEYIGKKMREEEEPDRPT